MRKENKMKTAVISYSLTGNNEALAASIADKMQATHIKVTEDKERTNWTIAWDMIFGKAPKIKPSAGIISGYDKIVLVGPVWMGGIASPLRAYVNEIKRTGKAYSFVSISGGALNDNPNLYDELVKKTGMKPQAVVDMHIKDLLPEEPTPTREMTSEYKVTGDDIVKLTDQAVGELAAPA
jgi:flavodoxin